MNAAAWQQDELAGFDQLVAAAVDGDDAGAAHEEEQLVLGVAVRASARPGVKRTSRIRVCSVPSDSETEYTSTSPMKLSGEPLM